MNLSRFPELNDLFSKRWFRFALPAAFLLGCLITRKDLPSFAPNEMLMGLLVFAIPFAIAVGVGLAGGWMFRNLSVFPFKSRMPVAAFLAIGSFIALGSGIREMLAGFVPFDFASAVGGIGFVITFTREKRDTPQP